MEVAHVSTCICQLPMVSVYPAHPWDWQMGHGIRGTAAGGQVGHQKALCDTHILANALNPK